MNFLSNPINRAILIGAVAVLIALFSYFSIVQPKLTQYNDSKARLAQDQQQYADLERVAEEKPQYIALIQQIQLRLKGTELTADPRAYIPSYLKQVEKLATDDGLQVTAVTPQATPSPSPGPSASPAAANPQALTNIAPIGAASRAAAGASGQAFQANQVATATGATPIPGQPPPAGTAASTGPNGVPLRSGNAPTSARQNAIAYLNQSFTDVPINMELSGTYDQFEKFLRDLNKFPKLVGVGNASMTPGGQTVAGVTPPLNIVLPITAYRLSAGSAQTQSGPLPGAAGSTGNGG
jgi:Tfp pilus assembly protein PilO